MKKFVFLMFTMVALTFAACNKTAEPVVPITDSTEVVATEDTVVTEENAAADTAVIAEEAPAAEETAE